MGGVATVTDRPPVGVRLKFWFFGGRVPAEWLPWVEAQIASPRYSLQRFARFAAMYLATMLAIGASVEVATRGRSSAISILQLFAGLIGAVIGSLLFGERGRRLELRYQRGEVGGGINFGDMSLRDFVVWGVLGLGSAAVISFAVIRFT